MTMKEINHPFFGKQASIRFNNTDKNNVKASVVCLDTSSAWSDVLNYDKVTDIMEYNNDKLIEILNHFRKEKHKKSSIAIKILNFIPNITFKIGKSIKSLFNLKLIFLMGFKGLMSIIMAMFVFVILFLYLSPVIIPLIAISGFLAYKQNQESIKEISSFKSAIMNDIHSKIVK